MTIRFKTLQRFGRIGSILAAPAVLFLFFQPNVGQLSRPLEIVSNVFLFSLGGIGALAAILIRAGVVQFTYSEADKHTLMYQMSKYVALRERGIWGATFSRRYYESFDLDKEKSHDSTLEPPKPPEELVKIVSILCKGVGFAFIAGGIISLLLACILLFKNGNDAIMLAAAFFGGSIFNIVVGTMVVRYMPRFMLGRFQSGRKRF